MGTILSLVMGFFSMFGSPQPAAVVANSPQRALLDQYCVTCHNERLKTAGVMFDKLDVQHVSQDAETWEKAVQQLRARSMPPVGRPRPDKNTYDGFRIWLEN